MSQDLVPFHTLRPIERRAIQALLDAPSVHAAAKTLGKSPRTLFRWLQNPAFRRCLEETSTGRDLSFEVRAQRCSDDALSVLSAVAADADKDLAQRVAAARHILEYADRRSARRRPSD